MNSVFSLCFIKSDVSSEFVASLIRHDDIFSSLYIDRWMFIGGLSGQLFTFLYISKTNCYFRVHSSNLKMYTDNYDARFLRVRGTPYPVDGYVQARYLWYKFRADPVDSWLPLRFHEMLLWYKVTLVGVITDFHIICGVISLTFGYTALRGGHVGPRHWTPMNKNRCLRDMAFACM